jgi:hypothetical protein
MRSQAGQNEKDIESQYAYQVRRMCEFGRRDLEAIPAQAAFTLQN